MVERQSPSPVHHHSKKTCLTPAAAPKKITTLTPPIKYICKKFSSYSSVSHF